MAVAVIILSPVTIITLTEASWHFSTDSLTSCLKESLRPKMPIKTNSYWSIRRPFSPISNPFSKSSLVISL